MRTNIVFYVRINTAPERAPSAEDVRNTVYTLTNLPEEDYLVHVVQSWAPDPFKYRIEVTTYETMLPTAEDIQRVLSTAQSDGAQPFDVTVRLA